MVVDDENDILEVIAIILKMRGFEVVTFNNAENLLERIKQTKPDLVLLDVQLGSYDGRQLCKNIKEVEEHTHLPVILFSANKLYEPDLEKSQCNDFIEKPFEVDYFISRITHHTQQR